MSVDIDWSLLSDPAAASLSESLIAALNAQLNKGARPSFVGPITITSFDFGTVGPEVEIKDIRDVWRAFDEGDDEGDALLDAMENERLHEELAAAGMGMGVGAYPPPPPSGYAHSSGYSHTHTPSYSQSHSQGLRRPTRGRHQSTPGPHPVPPVRLMPAASTSAVSLSGQNLYDEIPGGGSLAVGDLFDDGHSVHSMHSGFHSGRNSVASVGLGVHVLRRATPRYPLGVPSTPPRVASATPGVGVHAHGHGAVHNGRRDSGARPASSTPHMPADSTNLLSPPPSPPARPPGLKGADSRPNPLPSAQIHLRLDHASNLSLTLLTSLQVNYPSPLFMTLPLKLVITGLTLAADLVLAYSGQKHRVYMTIVDTGDAENPPTPGPVGYAGGAGSGGYGPTGYGAGSTHGGAYAVGQRILPNLHIESDIGSADAHVLRNVGKVERFIVDAVRKTLVDELVFPNFQTIAL